MTDTIHSRENKPLPTESAQNGSSGGNAGSTIGIIIIVLVLALGGLYFWGKRAAENGRQETRDMGQGENGN